MDNRPIIAYIQQLSQQGYTEATIRDQLKSSGWTPDVIDQAYRDYNANIVPTPAPDGAQPVAKKRKHMLIITGIVVLVAVILYVAIITLPAMTPPPTVQQKNDNTAREDDTKLIASTIGRFALNHSGALPEKTDIQAKGDTLYLCGSSCDVAKESTTLEHYKPQNIRYRLYSDGTKAPNTETVFIVNKATCSGMNITSSAEAKKAALLFALETNSGIEQRCLAVN